MKRLFALAASACLFVSGCNWMEDPDAPEPGEATETNGAPDESAASAGREETAAGGPLSDEIAAFLPLKGLGQEPSWHVRVERDVTTFYRQDELLISFPTREPDTLPARMRFEDPDGPSHVVFQRTLCRDVSTGMPHPYTVIARPRSDVFEGCGGDPETLFSGATWTLVTLDDEPFVSEGELSIRFEDGRVTGAGGCNRFMGGYTLTGEALTLSQVASTEMACSRDDVMEQEARLLERLSRVEMFDITDDGELVLRTGLGQTVRAVREP
ncbi:MAG: META domain-containing protein [Oceanicaulis sp.]|nr:META domain-containing protein [Oceanicaulis sp.]